MSNSKWIFKIQHSTTSTKYVYLRLSENSQKYNYFPKIFITICSIAVYQTVLLHQIDTVCQGLLLQLYVPSEFITSVHQIFSESSFYQILLLQFARYFQNLHSTRNCCFSPPDISRIFILAITAASVRQILLYYCITVLLHFLNLLMYYCHLVLSVVILNHDFTSV